jgi:hypothetical protein
MEFPKLGILKKDPKRNLFRSEPIPVSMLSGKECAFILEYHDIALNKGDFQLAVSNFLSATTDVLKDVEEDVYQYFKDCREYCKPDLACTIRSPSDVWNHVRLGSECYVQRRGHGDREIYLSLECECDWEPEHGLQIVFKNGLRVNKVGPFDGHLTNADAYADASLETLVYCARI